MIWPDVRSAVYTGFRVAAPDYRFHITVIRNVVFVHV